MTSPVPPERGAPGARVTVVIATAARPERATALRRAIAGALAQSERPEVIVVVNGAGVDPVVAGELEQDARIRVERLAAGSYPAAQRRGRELVRTPFFCFLDDDDELLPGSIECRLRRALAADAPDLVVGHGLRHVDGRDVDFVARRPADDEAASAERLMLSLLCGQGNWFASTAPLMRSDTVGLEFFNGTTKYYEWTLIAFRVLAAGRRMAFVPEYCFRLHESPVSLSKNPAGTLATPDFLRTLLTLAPGAAVRAQLRRRLADAHHAVSDLHLRSGRLGEAWAQHLRSLALPGGLRFLGYTRRLLLPVIARRHAGAVER